MNQVKKLWNWRPDPALMKTAKARAIRGLGAFLALMVMCTLVARAADTITVPVVTVATPTRSALTHTYSVSGMLETAGGTPVLAPSGMTVTEVAVAQGDIVAEGDLLFTVDTTETAREIAAKQLTLQSLRLELADLQKKLALADEKAGTDFDRAEEDYDSVEAAWELKLQEAGERLRQARTALMKYDGIRSWDYDDEEFTEEEYNSLRSEYRTASIAYDQAEAEREDALREAKRKVDDLDDPEPEPDSSPARKSLDIRQTELELAALYEAVATEGEVHAPAAGIVTHLSVEAGRPTAAESQATIAREDSVRFTAEITAEQRKFVVPGDPIELTLSGATRGQETPVTAIQPVADKPDTYAITAELPADTGEPGRGAQAKITRRTQVYDACVPVNALYGQEGSYYLLGVREVETTLGTEYAAEKLPVTLEEHNGQTAAVSGPLTQDTKIIVDASRPVREDDRIRLQG